MDRGGARQRICVALQRDAILGTQYDDVSLLDVLRRLIQHELQAEAGVQAAIDDGQAGSLRNHVTVQTKGQVRAADKDEPRPRSAREQILLVAQRGEIVVGMEA